VVLKTGSSMTRANQEQARPIALEWVVASVLGIAALGSFALQAYTLSSKTTQLETVLFNCFQFVLTVGFAWFSTRALSRKEFEASLKRFAIGAYRRVSDIEQMVMRLNHQLALARPRSPEHEADLRVVSAIVSDTAQALCSSKADWADVIEGELIALDQLKRLEHERAQVEQETKSPETTSRIEKKKADLDVRIQNLRSRLPLSLQVESTMNEFLLVRFDEDRSVIVNGAAGEGRTNQVLRLQAGTYVITLAPPPNFTPAEIKVVLKNTTVFDPKEITFTKVP
jgi:hypothetical protein